MVPSIQCRSVKLCMFNHRKKTLTNDSGSKLRGFHCHRRTHVMPDMIFYPLLVGRRSIVTWSRVFFFSRLVDGDICATDNCMFVGCSGFQSQKLSKVVVMYRKWNSEAQQNSCIKATYKASAESSKHEIYVYYAISMAILRLSACRRSHTACCISLFLSKL